MDDSSTDPWELASAIYSTSSSIPNHRPEWRPHHYDPQTNINAHDKFKAPTIVSPTNFHLETGNVNRLDSSWMGLEAMQPHLGLSQYTPQNASASWNFLPLKIPCCNEIPSRCNHPGISPSWQAVTLSAPSGSAWVTLADSGYGTFTNSNLGSGSGLDDSMTHSTHHFTNANCEDSPCDNSEVPSPASTALKLVRERTAHKPANSGQRGRLRQYAHSKVEKRYRMNINSKIKQLKDMLPPESQLENQSLAEMSPVCSSRRHRRGAELSKRDVLTRTIGFLLQLQDELRQLKCQNIELKAEIAHSRSVGS